MVAILLIALFCFALIIALIGLYLSPRSHTHTQRDVAYAPRTTRGVAQGNRTRSQRQRSPVDQPYRRARRSSAGQEQSYDNVYSSTKSMGVKDIVGLWSARFPRSLKLMLLSGAAFGFCLFLFLQMINFGITPVIAIFGYNSDPQLTPISVVYGEDLGASNASKSVVRIAQLDESQYSSQDEYNTWAYSACSVASMTEVINAYGHNYRLTDILKVEAGLHEITPELGLLEAKGIDRTMAQFGFKMLPFQHSMLDDAIAVANEGHPVIVSFRDSNYWPGGHILVLRGGDTQNVDLADSSRLDLTVVSRDQFTQWWTGFLALSIPQ